MRETHTKVEKRKRKKKYITSCRQARKQFKHTSTLMCVSNSDRVGYHEYLFDFGQYRHVNNGCRIETKICATFDYRR